ncbi:MAG TPA: hypothetical protein VFV95_22040, partial [Vicinamibacterales bacterium]|nr:hypothetical protein [Vicinamibacterales bacterium]
PGFLFIAEAYWGREWELQQLGFDFCYDKTLYDRLEHGDAESVRLHLSAEPDYQNRLVRFIENHDEPRAATAFHAAKARAVAVVSSTLPGARLFHEGQFDGRRVRLPVFLARRPGEPTDADLRQFYDRLLGASRGAIFREGRWRLCERSGWPDNASCLSLVAWTWEHGDERFLIVVNLSDRAAQAHVAVDWGGVAAGTWRLHDRLTGHTYDRSGDDLASGLYVDLGPWESHLFQCEKRKLP